MNTYRSKLEWKLAQLNVHRRITKKLNIDDMENILLALIRQAEA
jgi:hypothetical protein